MALSTDPPIVRARAPLRLGLAGGGTDVSPYSDDFGGLVLNATIDKFAYATISPRHDGQIALVSADKSLNYVVPATATLEVVPGLELLSGTYNRIVRDYVGGRGVPVTVTTHAEAPPGSGLGSSSAMVVALVLAFAEFLQIPLGEYDVAQLAYDIERVDLALAGGKQDQYAAAFGGFNFMEFYQSRVIVNPLRIRREIRAELESSLVLFYTGVSRDSATIIEQQTHNVRTGKTTSLDALHRLKQEAVRMKEAVLRGDIQAFVDSMRQSWESKKRMADSISNATIDAVFDAAISGGALAGKVSGAGGGGFMMFATDPTRRPDVIRALSNFQGQVFTCNFTDQGGYSWRT